VNQIKLRWSSGWRDASIKNTPKTAKMPRIIVSYSDPSACHTEPPGQMSVRG
jgi:hypothetical protein